MYFTVCLVRILQYSLICINYARAKIPNSWLYYFFLQSRHSKVSETVFIFKFGSAVAKIFEFAFLIICINYVNYVSLKLL